MSALSFPPTCAATTARGDSQARDLARLLEVSCANLRVAFCGASHESARSESGECESLCGRHSPPSTPSTPLLFRVQLPTASVDTREWESQTPIRGSKIEPSLLLPPSSSTRTRNFSRCSVENDVTPSSCVVWKEDRAKMCRGKMYSGEIHVWACEK